MAATLVGGYRSRSVMNNVWDCLFEENQLELLSRHYVLFQTKSPSKRMSSITPPPIMVK